VLNKPGTLQARWLSWLDELVLDTSNSMKRSMRMENDQDSHNQPATQVQSCRWLKSFGISIVGSRSVDIV
jgi:hypothetical protein